jgi:valyl-tRNA synthetase
MTMSTSLPKAYDPSEVEPKWYRVWLDEDYFHAEAAAPKTPYSIVIPPPNVTGSLHMGHALGSTIQDVLVRWRRMQGQNAMWLPGTDHAGISTQIVVEKDLQRTEGRTRHDLGREEFLRRTWAWKEKHGSRIVEQMKTMGFSLDWKRERFTMDEGLSRAVRECFVRLYDEGLIYRANRLINWCARCQTALSDLEVDVNDEKGALWEIAYPVTGDPGTRLVVATTRPETMLGDTAVAVHPEDERYRHLIGKTVDLPLTGRQIPIVGDAILVDREFGTGAVKVTPGHDFNDFETGVRHGLPVLSIFDLAGRVVAPAPDKYHGLDPREARAAVLADLEAGGFLVGQKDHTVPLGRCDRCGTVVEPLLSLQWFVRVEPLAKPAIEAVERGRTVIVPESWTKTYMHWMTHLKDWCISRQLWWGHRIPAWHCQDCAHVTVARTDPTECSSCGGRALKQDEDVLDTWFSSQLWPFSTLGWPDKTRDLATFYPTSVLVTGFDIIFFWVARMMMAGLHFMEKVPFRTVYIHALVVDENGDKMSKTKGNGIDPLDVVHGASKDELLARARAAGAPEATAKAIAKNFPDGIPAAGADALRFTLCALAAQGRNIRLSIARVEGYRHFANKIWNASRFALMNLGGFDADRFADQLAAGPGEVELGLPERWILSRLGRCTTEVNEALEAFRLNDAAHALYKFIWSELCDWYIELAKPALYHDDEATPDPVAAARRRLAQGTLAHTLETALRLLHPIMPFLTEEIWQQLPKPSVSPGSIMITLYPMADERFADAEAERRMGLVVEVAVAIRAIRSEYNVPPSQTVEVVARADGDARALLAELAPFIERSARCRLELVDVLPERAQSAKTMAGAGVELMVPLTGLIDVAAERARLERDAAKAEKEAQALGKKLGNESFVARAPAEVVAEVRARLGEESTRAERLRAAARALG